VSVVVDTNVPVVANARASQAPPECVVACVRELSALMKRCSGGIVLDDQWRIIQEYRAHLRPSGQPGLGDAFLKWVLTNRANPERCVLVRITPVAGSDPDFEEFPRDRSLNGFDPQDRKFVAVALAHPRRPPILQAVDARWWKFRNALSVHGVIVRFLCEDYVRGLSHRHER
jgi:hypothetical protein